MNKKRLTPGVVLTLLLSTLMLLPSCDDTDDYYDVPSWISGSIYEELESYGDYDIFLKGVEIAGFKTIVDGKSILTVMAPTDDSMTEYLQENYGTTDIEEVDEDEVTKLIGYHILYYSFTKDMLINFRPDEGDGATDEEKNVNGGLYYKFRTRSQDPISYKNEDTQDTAIYHYERLLPIFSYKMFNTKSIDAEYNYEYFYPETGWNGDDGFNVSNANVTEYMDISSNGYVYKIDRVLEPLETIYQAMKKSGNFNRYLELYDKNEYYEADEDLTLENSSSVTLYHHYHDGLPNIDCEWPVTDYQDISAMALTAYSVFAPTDQAWLDFFDDYWALGGYESLDDVDSTQIQAILTNSYYSESIVFPEEITNGDIENSDGELITFDPEEVDQDNRIICSNGVLYACNVLTPPTKFYSVTGPGYQYQKFSNFVYMIDNSGMTNTLTSSAVDYIMLYPDNDQIYNNAQILMYGGSLVLESTLKSIGSSLMSAYVYAHVVTPTDGETSLPTSGNKVLKCLSPDYNLYWYLKDGKITNSIKFLELLKYATNEKTEDDIFASFEPLAYKGDVDGWNNGHVYTYDSLFFFEGNYDNVNNNLFIRFIYNYDAEDATPEFFGWKMLLRKAGAISSSSYAVTFVTDDECLMLVPLTEAVEQGIIDGRVPGAAALEGATVGSADFFDYVEVTDADELLEYIKIYFIPMSTSNISNYPFIGWDEDTAAAGGIVTYQQETTTEGVESTNINIYDDGTKLTVTVIPRDTGVESDPIDFYDGYDYFPFVYEDGGVQFIEDIF